MILIYSNAARMRMAALLTVFATCLCVSTATSARGVTPYLPLNLSPDIERKIERVLILGDKPVMRRPIALAIVLDALPKACKRDSQLCTQVRHYLDLYMHPAGVTALRAEVAATSGTSDRPIPNQHGLLINDKWDVSGNAYYQPSDYLLLNAGGIAYQGRSSPAGSVLSAGFDFAQLDIGYRDHWMSPLTDSSMLMSTEAPTMPSVTLSNYQPLTSLGFNYELFLARMSTQQGITNLNTTTTGHPNLAGLQLGIEPASGYALAVNRLMQYGGGARGGSNLHEFYKALFDNTAANRADTTAQHEFGNQQAAVTSSMVFPGHTPFAVHIEYAAEDNAYAGNKYFGDTDLSLGIDFPLLLNNYDLSYEVSEWQNIWYTHHLYPLGMTNDGLVTGHWFGDERVFNNDIGGNTQMLRIGRRWGAANYLQVTYRYMALNPAWAGVGIVVPPYQPMREVGVSYATSWRGHPLRAEAFAGRDVFGKGFARLSGSVDIVPLRSNDVSAFASDDDDSTDSAIFVDAGINRSRVTKILGVSIQNVTTKPALHFHTAIGARRLVSSHSDLGARLELDQDDGHNLLSVRAIDYRYRLNPKFAVGGFFGVGRYSVGLPAYGWYSGFGVQYLELFKHWDLDLDWDQYHKLGRDKELANDPPSSVAERTRVFYDVSGIKLYFSRHF